MPTVKMSICRCICMLSTVFALQGAQERNMSRFLVVSGCMAALEAEHFLQEHEIQQGKSEPTTAENEALPENGRAPPEHRPV